MKRLASSHKGFTLVEIMIMVAIIARLAAIAVPGFLRARKGSEASRILNDLRMIDSACDQYAIETNRETGDARRWPIGPITSRRAYFFIIPATVCLAPLTVLRLSTRSRRCPRPTWAALSDVVADTGFWSPYGP
jgi:prepilin-type N-terminal cleavage/methylation domain-containing protein